MYFCDFQSFVKRKVGKYARHTLCKHCFTCSGTAYKKYVVIAGGGNFKRTLDVFLTFYVAKIKYI